ncbi:hypothetical protein D3C73_1485100 [compost metagenome]
MIEGLRLVLQADVVLDLPQLLVDRLQLSTQLGDVLYCRRVCHPRGLQRGQFLAHVGQLAFVTDALGLDLQDRDLVQQLAE